MYPGHVGHVVMHVHNQTYDAIDDIIMSKNMSTFGTAATSLIFQLERRSKAEMKIIVQVI